MEQIKFYEPTLGVDGTMPELLDWAYRYTDDYSDDALTFISEKAREIGADYRIPELCRDARKRSEDELPYENLKLEKIVYGKVIGDTFATSYGDVQIGEDRDNILICITGIDDEGSFTAASGYPVEEFMAGDEKWLEQTVGALLYYNKLRD